ncbi:MAG: winged helix-turn-helix domain-containing protein [Nitrosotalea sp.]
MSSTTINIVKNENLEPDFEPSMKTLLRIMESMTSNRSEGKTCLARDTNLNYSRLAKHIVWLEKKGLVESVVDDQKINVVLTQKGRTFGTMLIA